jgi:hypothetical protein
MTYYKWTGKITKIGKKENPSSYARIPKFIMTENGLKQDGEYNFTIEEVETIPKPPKTDYNGVKIDNQEDKATAQN